MRTKNSARNVTYAFVGQFFGLLISFITRLVFIRTLNTEYLGIGGLFTNILNILCFTELGIGTAISFSLYEPLDKKNIEKIKSLMYFFRKIYISVGLFILLLGLACLPLYRFTLNVVPDIPSLDLIYILFVINTSISYFFSYKRTLIITDQKRYIATIYRYLFYFLLNLFQIIILCLTKNYILFLIVQIIFTVLENYFLSKKADELYPYLKEKKVIKLQKEDYDSIFNTFKSIVFHKFGGMILRTTDNICISKLLGIVWVGLYSNYYLITNALETVISQIFNSIVASIGNLNVENSKTKMENVFHKMFFLNYWIYGFCSICLINLTNPFISLWLGDQFLLSPQILFVIVVNFFIFGMRKTCITFREATGNYSKDKYSPIIEAIINISSSIIFTKIFGLAGVFMGTILSCLCTCFWWEPLVIYKKSLKSKLNDYFIRYSKYAFITFVTCILTCFINSFFVKVNLLNFILKIIICAIVPNFIFVLFNYKNEEFKYFYKFLIGKIRRKK